MGTPSLGRRTVQCWNRRAIAALMSSSAKAPARHEPELLQRHGVDHLGHDPPRQRGERVDVAAGTATRRRVNRDAGGDVDTLSRCRGGFVTRR